MTDNTTLPLTGSGDGTVVVATDDIGGVEYQRIKVGYGEDGSYTDAGTTNPFPVDVRAKAASACSQASVNDTASNVTLLAANANRLGATIFNDSASDLYVKFGATASTSSFHVKIPGGALYELPTNPRYTGIIDGIWSADSTGAARIGEFTA